MQGKVLVNPCYLHNFWTFFDEIDGSCVRAGSAEEVVAYLRRHAQGQPQPASESAYRELMRRGVYASRDEPFDVLGAYSRHVRELAGAATLTRS